METENKKDNESKGRCCKPAKEGKGFLQGLIYGLIPHAGCIAFILFSVLGVTAATSFFRPLLMNRYFFHILILLSLAFATISAALYLKKNSSFSLNGAMRKWKYLSILYGTSVGVNALLFLVVFPLAANMNGAAVAAEGLSEMTLKVDIPCSGHAPLISESLKKVDGVESVKFRFPNYFDVAYNQDKTSASELVSIDVFTPYPAEIISGGETNAANNISAYSPQNQPASGCISCGGCSGACGGACSI